MGRAADRLGSYRPSRLSRSFRTKVMVTGTGPSGTPFAFSPDGPKGKGEAQIVSCPKPKK